MVSSLKPLSSSLNRLPRSGLRHRCSPITSPGTQSAHRCRCGCQSSTNSNYYCVCSCCAHSPFSTSARNSFPTQAPASASALRLTTSIRIPTSQKHPSSSPLYHSLSTCLSKRGFSTWNLPRPQLPTLIPTRRYYPRARPFATMAQEYKLIGLASLADVKSFDKIECEVEGVQDGKVLVLKYDGQVHALSPRCTHYGAPLKLGVVVPDGRITCPWHGGM